MKKSGWVLVILLVGVFLGFFQNVGAVFSGLGSGTAADPYQITSCSQFISATSGTANYKLMNDLDCPSVDKTFLMPSLGSSYTFDGNGKTISNLRIPVFSSFSGTIKDLYLDNVNIVSSSRYVGAIAGSSSATGKVSNVHITGSVTGVRGSDIYVGGFFGRMDGANSYIEKSSFSGIVNGTVTSPSALDTGCSSIGGLVGFNNVETLAAIKNSYTQGVVFGRRVSSTGRSTVCLRVGGIIGSSYRIIERVYSTANVIGYVDSKLLTSASSGVNQGVAGINVNDGSGCLRCSDISNYWDVQTSGTTYSVFGTGKSSQDMKLQSTYSSWNFTSIWRIHPSVNGGYPFIKGHKIFEQQYNDFVSSETDLLNDQKCMAEGKVFLFPIENKTEGSGNITFNISLPIPIKECTILLTGESSDYYLSNTTAIINATNHTERYGLDSPLPVGEYTAIVLCNCVLSGLGSNEISFKVLSPFDNTLKWMDMDGDELTLRTPTDYYNTKTGESMLVYSRPVDKGDSVIASFGSTNLNTLVNYSVTKLGVGSSVVRTGQTDKGFVILNFSEVGDYTFKAYYGNAWHESGKNISVLSTESNNIPEAIIDFNSEEAVVNQVLEFNHLSKDLDDQLVYTWDFGDGTNSSYEYSLFEKGINSSLGKVNHSYSSPGVYLISLNVQEVGRVQNSKSYFTIQVFKEGINVFPTISPVDGEVLTSRWVLMDGSDVLVLNCSTSSTNPSAEPVAQNSLYCTRLNEELVSLDNNLIGYSLFFNWSLGENQYRSGYWNNEDYYNSVIFRTRFKDSEVHNVDLKVTYKSGNVEESGFSSSSFSTGTTEFECVRDASSAFWRNLSANWDIHWIYNLTMSSLPSGMCSNETYMSESWCCPNNMYCSDGGTCEPVEFMITCSELIDQTSCENPDINTAAGLFLLFPENEFGGICDSEINFDSYFDVVSGAICSNSTYCGCTWDASARVCKSSLYFESNCENADPVISTCSWSQEGEVDDRCDSEGIMLINYVASSEGAYFDNGNGESFCENQRVEYPCSVSVQLPFFSSLSFILSLLLIVGIYFLTKNK